MPIIHSGQPSLHLPLLPLPLLLSFPPLQSLSSDLSSRSDFLVLDLVPPPLIILSPPLIILSPPLIILSPPLTHCFLLPLHLCFPLL
jgi:hypothetical protein